VETWTVAFVFKAASEPRHASFHPSSVVYVGVRVQTNFGGLLAIAKPSRGSGTGVRYYRREKLPKQAVYRSGKGIRDR
jgi:hypothetical protein